MVKEPKPRVLRELMDGAYLYTEDFSVGGLQILYATTGGAAPGTEIVASDWEIYTTTSPALGGTQFAVNRQYYDLQGYVQDGISFFPTNPQVQDMADWQSTRAIRMYDFFTVKPINNEELELFLNPVFQPNPPGSSGNLLDLQDIIYGRWRILDPSQDTQGTTIITQSGTFGLNTPTARDRIFLTRVVFASNADNSVTFVPPCAFVLAGVSAEEKDLVYIERLRRNYDHSSTVG